MNYDARRLWGVPNATPFVKDGINNAVVSGAQGTVNPHWRDYPLFYEYFHGDTGRGVGASHQTGWTALVAKLLEQTEGK